MASHPEILKRVQRLNPGTIIELFELDLSPLGGDILFFHSSITNGNVSIFFNGNEYIPRAIKGEGWQVTGNSQLPRPTMSVANTDFAISALMAVYNGLRGAKLTRIRTFLEYTDGQPGADPTQHFPLDVYFVSHSTSLANTEATFELRAAPDLEGLYLPRGQIIAHSCQWTYRGPECEHARTTILTQGNDVKGNPLPDLSAFFDQDDNPLNGTRDRGSWSATGNYQPGDFTYKSVKGIREYYVCVGPVIVGLNPVSDAGWSTDICGRRLTSCKCRFGQNGVLNTSAYPGTYLLTTNSQ